MKDITLSVPDKDYSFFMKLIKQLDFVQIRESQKKATKEQFLTELKEAVDEVNLAKQGKIKLKTAEQLLSEL
ncbi:MAG: hypothetical protein K9G49_09285 [Taibaiella sp.]|nr:hypothetical protein [Taibaiella sp.]